MGSYFCIFIGIHNYFFIFLRIFPPLPTELSLLPAGQVPRETAVLLWMCCVDSISLATGIAQKLLCGSVTSFFPHFCSRHSQGNGQCRNSYPSNGNSVMAYVLISCTTGFWYPFKTFFILKIYSCMPKYIDSMARLHCACGNALPAEA